MSWMIPAALFLLLATYAGSGHHRKPSTDERVNSTSPLQRRDYPD